MAPLDPDPYLDTDPDPDPGESKLCPKRKKIRDFKIKRALTILLKA